MSQPSEITGDKTTGATSQFCVLCNREFVGHGYNPGPLYNYKGEYEEQYKCCDSCSNSVIAARLYPVSPCPAPRPNQPAPRLQPATQAPTAPASP